MTHSQSQDMGRKWLESAGLRPTRQRVAIAALLVGQLWAMTVLLRDPEGRAPWYNGTGVLMYVSGMMVAAFALRGMGG